MGELGEGELRAQEVGSGFIADADRGCGCCWGRCEGGGGRGGDAVFVCGGDCGVELDEEREEDGCWACGEEV